MSTQPTNPPSEAITGIHDLIGLQCRRTPDAVAVSTAGESLTYRALDERSDRLALRLRAAGVGRGDAVGIWLDRTPDLVVALLGVLKSGAAYVPLNPSHPKSRLTFILEETKLRVLVIDTPPPVEIYGSNVQLMQVNDGITAATSPREDDRCAAGSDPAYMIYTSGSTGNPKGVVVPHRAVVNLLRCMARRLDFTAQDTLLAVTTLSFDIAALELFLPLTVGGRVALASPQEVMDPTLLLQSLRDAGTTVMQATPTTWKMLMARAPTPQDFHLRTILCGGEPLARDVADFLLHHAERVWNLYGPTETTIWSTLYRVDAGPGPVPIGGPVDSTTFYVVDAQDTPVPVGVEGELLIGGAGLALGYLNSPELTAARFVRDPFTGQGLVFRTGDRVKQREDGALEFIGRTDQQLKIRGVRVEPIEIESAIRTHAAVADVVVASPDGEKLVAYVVPRTPPLPLSGRLTPRWDESLAQWREVWEQTYRLAPAAATDFNVAGLNSSYTGLALPADQIREWLEYTVGRIRRLAPRRVLEVGCGTGLLMRRLAPDCERYCATDFSASVLAELSRDAAAWPGVELREARADDFTGFEADAFDLVILNSVIQYFPDVDYLLTVLRRAVGTVRSGGHIFVGDIRQQELLDVFHLSVELYRAPDALQSDELRRRVRRRVSQEAELVLSPAFFAGLVGWIPRVTHVEVQLKHGALQHELSTFRYDVVIHVGELGAEDGSVATWGDPLPDLATLRDFLAQSSPHQACLRHVRNRRLQAAFLSERLLREPHGPSTAAALRAATHDVADGVDPETVWSTLEALPYDVAITPSADDASCFDVLCCRRGFDSGKKFGRVPRHERESAGPDVRSHANEPEAQRAVADLGYQLRAFLRQQLPETLVPQQFVIVDELPRTPNGKLDRRRLPAADAAQRPAQEYVAASDRLEQQLVEIWEDCLGIRPIGITDNFFDLGGHSLLAIRLFARIEQLCGKVLPIAVIFRAPTIVELARLLTVEAPETESVVLPLQPAGKLPPIYFLPSGLGPGLHLRPLALAVGDEQPFYAVGGERGRFHDCGAVQAAEILSDEICRFQPTGPLSLGGHSYSGLVAFEMARQLQQRGREVLVVAMVDTPCPNSPRPAFPWKRFVARQWQQLRRFGLRQRLELFTTEVTNKLGRRFMSADQVEMQQKWDKFYDYKPKPYNGAVMLFRSSDPDCFTFRIQDPQMGWGEFAPGCVHVCWLPGGHSEMVVEPQHAEQLGRVLSTYLVRAHARGLGGDPSQSA